MPEKNNSHRIIRPEATHLEDDTGHLWAISYADLLMVLLSFFVLFFSIDPNADTMEDIISKIVAVEFQGSPPPSPGSEPSPPTPKPAKFAAVPVAELLPTLREHEVTVEEAEKFLILQLPHNIYKTGQVYLDNNLKRKINSVLDKLQPYLSQIEITFIGHTDIQPVKKRHFYVQDNTDLSVLRASKVLQHSIDLGFPADHLAAKGSSFTRRNSRTLSIVIQPYRSNFQ